MMLNGNNNYVIRKVVPIVGDGTNLKPYQVSLLPQTFQLMFCSQKDITPKPFPFPNNALSLKD